MKLQYTFTRKIFLQGLRPRIPTSPLAWRGVLYSWGINTTRNKDLWIRKIIKLHNQQSPTWRMVTTTPPQFYLLDYDPPWTWKISHLPLHAWTPTKTEKELNFYLITPFVYMSAGFCLVCIFSNFKCPSSKAYHMKWYLNYICLVLRFNLLLGYFQFTR